MNTRFRVLLAVFVLIGMIVSGASAAHITIVESESGGPDQIQALWWGSAIPPFLHRGDLIEQEELDSPGFIAATDMLIVTSGSIPLTDARVAVIQAMVVAGKAVYLQAEYPITQSTTQAFETIVNNLGGDFSWDGQNTGSLTPMEVRGVLGNGGIHSINTFESGVYGSGTIGMTQDLVYMQQTYGWTFDPPNPSYGLISCSTDDEWVRTGSNTTLLTNYFNRMLDNTTSGLLLYITPLNSIIYFSGNINFRALIINSSGTAWTGQGWYNLRLPNDMNYGPVPVTGQITLPVGGATQEVDRSIFIPAMAPAGHYYFFGNLGTLNPFLVETSDTFEFSKLQ